jgi:Domain of unknown function (DUF2383)
MNELRLPTQASSVSLQTALTRALDSRSTYLHAARISDSGLLGDACREFAAKRSAQIDRLASMIERAGGRPDFGPSHEAGFQRIWMTLVSRRFPTFRDGLPRECERSERRLERVLVRLLNESSTGESTRRELGWLIRDLRHDLRRLRSLRHPRGKVPVVRLCQPRPNSQDLTGSRR